VRPRHVDETQSRYSKTSKCISVDNLRKPQEDMLGEIELWLGLPLNELEFGVLESL
jgi:hypothetical protein